MNQPASFRYIQAGQPCATRDMRNRRETEIAREHCYFVGLRVTVENEMRYRHSLILADDYKALTNGIAEEHDTILSRQFVASPHDIETVFVRNLEMHETTMIDSIVKCGIAAEIQQTLSRRDDYRFTVVGRLENEQICLIHENAQDALTAMRLARFHRANFHPLDVRQAHPATREFDSLFHQVAAQFIKLLGDSCRTGYVH